MSAYGRRGRWEQFPPSTPRAVEGGLVARSARGAIGEQWWSQRFIATLESFALGTRLTRGKNYARRGQVISLDVAPGTVKAQVQGSRRTPYAVTIALPVFTELVWARVEIALAEQAIHCARLLAGEMPLDIEEVFAAAGAPLFPQRVADMTLACSCPDFAVPCKHLAATFYLLAEQFDDDPFEILLWRGRGRTQLLGRLRQLRSGPGAVGDEGAGPAYSGAFSASGAGTGSGTPAGPVSAAGSGLRVGAMLALADLGVVESDFWGVGPIPELPVHPDLPVDLLLRQLPEPSALLGRREFVAFLEPLYAILGTSQE